MSILIDKDTRVMTQGITGKTGAFHTRLCRDYAYGRECFVAGVNPNKAGETFENIPIFGSAREAKQQTGATVSVIYVPPAFAAGAIDEAVDADLDLVICITEGVPVRDMIATRNRMRGKRTLLVGPNCPGVITPDEIKIGIMPGHPPEGAHRRRIAFRHADLRGRRPVDGPWVGAVDMRGDRRRPGQRLEAYRHHADVQRGSRDGCRDHGGRDRRRR
jgi:hypothetical protein